MGINIKSLHYRFPKKDARDWELVVGPLQIERGEFVLLVGNSGAGKSTLLRAIQGLLPAFHGGELSIVLSDSIERSSELFESTDIGLMLQDADNQLIMPDVLSELVFGMEQIGLSPQEMNLRLEQLQTWFDWKSFQNRAVEHLSGGEKQKVTFASILLMQPKALLLDEPTAHLDQQSIQKLYETIKNVKNQANHAILLADHHVPLWLPLADRVIWLDQGHVRWQGSVTDWLNLSMTSPETWHWLPLPTLANVMASQNDTNFSISPSDDLHDSKHSLKSIQVTDLTFTYPESNQRLESLSFQIPLNELSVLLGENGCGKSTLLKLLAGIIPADKGSIRINDQTDVSIFDASQRSCWFGYVSQQSNDHLLHDRVEDELWYSLKLINADHDLTSAKLKIDAVAETFELTNMIRNAHPRDLSSGERQRVALASVLIRKPMILLIDEPTHGLSNRQKDRFSNWIRSHHLAGGSALIATHDHEFAAEWATTCFIMHNQNGCRSVSQFSTSDIFIHHPMYRTSLASLAPVHRLKDAIAWLQTSRQQSGSRL